jgi:MFS transporter, FHS family, L-fucose permease
MENKKSDFGPLLIIGILFFVFGFVTWVNGTLISFFKKAFNLDNSTSYLVTFAFFISYTVMAIPASWVLKKVGFKKGMSLGLLIMAVGTAIFIPAAQMASYNMFLVGLFGIGIGLTLLQTASNPYVTILGDKESAAQRISFMGIANKTAGIISQKIFGAMLLAGTTAGVVANADPSAELSKVINPYMILTAVLVFLAVLIFFTKGLPEIDAEEDEALKNSERSIFSHANLVLGCLAIFCCVGLEVIAGDTIINYGKDLGFAESEAKDFGTYTLWFMMLGYILGIICIPKYISQQKILAFAGIFGVVVTVMAIFTSGFNSVFAIALLGVSNAIMWPAIWPLALDGLGKHTKYGSALLIMMIAGGALLPLVYGSLADSTNTQHAYWLMVPLYLYILYFAASGYKKKTW